MRAAQGSEVNIACGIAQDKLAQSGEGGDGIQVNGVWPVFDFQVPESL